jgi:hypothetical protein
VEVKAAAVKVAAVTVVAARVAAAKVAAARAAVVKVAAVTVAPCGGRPLRPTRCLVVNGQPTSRAAARPERGEGTGLWPASSRRVAART